MQLKFTEDILPVTDFRNNAADVLTQLVRTGRPVVLTQRGRASAVLIEVGMYQRLQERLADLEKQLVDAGIAVAPETSAPVTVSAVSDAQEVDLVRELENLIERRS